MVGEIGGSQVLLTKVDVVGAGGDGFAPVVVDDQLAAVADADVQRLENLAADLGFARVLEPELNRPHAQRHQPPHPADVRHDRIEDIEARRHGAYSRVPGSKKGVPATGVEGRAISRISMRPAS